MICKIEVQVSGKGMVSEICIFLCMEYLVDSNYLRYNERKSARGSLLTYGERRMSITSYTCDTIKQEPLREE